MGEKSHIDDMRAAIRGDLERARSRRPSIFEAPAAPPVEIRGPRVTPAPEPEPTAAPEPEPVVAEELPRPEPIPLPEVPPAAAVPEPPEPKRRARFAFWRG